MSVTSVQHRANLAEQTTTKLSPSIWAGCPISAIRENPNLGSILDLNFANVPLFASAVSQLGFITLQDTGVVIGGDPAEPGALRWSGQDADNDAGVLTTSGNVAGSFVIPAAGNTRKLWAEFAVKKSIITNDGMAFFIGLTEEGMAAATNTLLGTNSADLADKDLIGFHLDQADGDAIDFVYNKASAGGVTIKIAGVEVPVANTYTRLGFIYDPNAISSKKIKIFVNGLEQTTYVTAANIANTTTFPGGEELAFTVAVKVGTGSLTETFHLGGGRIVQLAE